jgi:hypothetical protein
MVLFTAAGRAGANPEGDEVFFDPKSFLSIPGIGCYFSS